LSNLDDLIYIAGCMMARRGRLHIIMRASNAVRAMHVSETIYVHVVDLITWSIYKLLTLSIWLWINNFACQ